MRYYEHNIMKFLTTLFVILFYSQAFAQAEEYNLFKEKFTKADSIALTTKYKSNIALLTNDLTKNCTSQLEKTRAIFIWITHNIAYDYKFYNKKKNKRKKFKCGKKKNCDARYAEWKINYLEDIIRKKKGICNGYAELFHTMCGYAGIQSNVVAGYTKDEPGQIGKMGILDHDWNVVLIDGKYFFVDATWAAGYCTVKKGKLDSFTYRYNDYYWLTPIDKLSRNHFPEDSTWIKHTTFAKAKQDYKNVPYIKEHLMPDVDIISPESGIVSVKLGDTIHFKITNTRHVNYIQAVANFDNYKTPQEIVASGKEWNAEEIKKQKYLPYTQDGNTYSFYVVADTKKLRHYDIMFNHNQSLRFKVIVK